MVTDEEFEKLKKEVESIKRSNFYYASPFFIDQPNLGIKSFPTIIGAQDNIYHRTCRQLKQHLNDLDIPVTGISRSSVGEHSFYNVEFDLLEKEYDFHKIKDYKIAKLLNINNVGLVDFTHEDDKYFLRMLIDEKELNNKYLKDGNLIFNQNI